jgi:NADH-quinone oxidoreductase subunit N
VLGAFTSAVMLYGMSLVYGLAGSTSLARIREAFAALAVPGAAGDPRYLALAAVVLVAAGVCFKISAVPFQRSAPDSCEDAPAPVAAFVSVGVRAAGVVILARLFLEGLPAMRAPGGVPGWGIVLGIVAAVTMTWGTLAAITTRSARQLVACSSVANAGYLLLGPVAGNGAGFAGLVISLGAYVASSLGAFGVLAAIGRERGSVDDLDGLAKRSPGLAVLMAIFLLGLAGLPPTAGLVGRVFLVNGLVASGDPWLAALALVAVLNAAVSAYYYFVIVKAMFVGEPAEGSPDCATSGGVWAALGVVAALTLLVGVFPRPAIALSERAVERIVRVQHQQGE